LASKYFEVIYSCHKTFPNCHGQKCILKEKYAINYWREYFVSLHLLEHKEIPMTYCYTDITRKYYQMRNLWNNNVTMKLLEINKFTCDRDARFI
jgi:hypothetical protein